MPERIQRFAFEIAVSPPFHCVIFKRRKLIDTGIESDRQASGGIVLSRKCLRDSRAAFFARIPGFQNRVHMLLCPVHGEGASVGEHEYDWLSRGRHRFEQLLFRLRQINAGAVAAFKSFLAHRHLFAFELAGDSHHRNHHIRVLRRFNCGGIWLRIVLRPNQLGLRGPGFRLPVPDFEGRLLALLKMNVSDLGLDRSLSRYCITNGLPSTSTIAKLPLARTPML